MKIFYIALAAFQHVIIRHVFSRADNKQNEVFKALQKRGLVYKTADTYKITNPIFKEWLLGLK